MSRISDSLLEAFDIAISERIDKLEYDKTIQATITEIANPDEGEYKVKYKEGIISAFAYDPTEVFKIGDLVYVTVPQGDFGNKKFISHKLSNNSLSTGQYKDLSNTVIEVSPNFLGSEIPYDPDIEYGLIAHDPSSQDGTEKNLCSISYYISYNDGNPNSIVTLTAEINGSSYQWQYRKTGDWNNSVYTSKVADITINNMNQNGIQYRCVVDGKITSTVKFTVWKENNSFKVSVAMPSLSDNFKLYVDKYEYVKISADFMTTLPIDATVTQGDYGLLFLFKDKNDQLISCTLNTSDFMGDPYNLWTWFPQSTIVKLPKEVETLESIKFYEKNFNISYEIDNPSPNLFVKNLSLSFVEHIDLSDTPYYLSILSNNGLSFSDGVSEITLTGHIIHYGEEITPNSCIYQWFKRDLTISAGSEQYDKRVGWGWKLIPDASLKSLSIQASEESWSSQTYKLLVVYDSNIIMTQEVTLFKEELKVAISQKAYDNDIITLELVKTDPEDQTNYKAKWYYLNSNGSQQEITSQSETESSNIVPYLYYSTATFYCSISDSNDNYLGELTYTMRTLESKDDVAVTFVGESLFSYDANGDINIYDSELERSLTPIISFNTGIISSSVSFKWLDSNGNEIPSDGSYTPRDSMIKTARVDSTTNILYYKIKHKFTLYPSKNNSFRLQITTLDGQQYEFEKEIICTKTGDPGTNGTRYQSLIAVVLDNKFVDTDPPLSNPKTVSLHCSVFKDDIEISGNDSGVTLSFNWSATNLTITAADQSNVTVQAKSTDNRRYVKATITITDNGKRTILYDFYPIDSCSVFPAPNIDLSALPKYIQYSASGKNPQMRRDVPTIEGVSSIESENDVITISGDSDRKRFKPLDEFVPEKEFIDNEYVIVNTIGLLKITTSSAIIYHPVPSYINTFGNEAINDWDGMSIDLGTTDGSTIFAPQIGAGKKDASTNAFDGVIMGVLNKEGQSQTGIYGYQKGETAFGLLENGTAFFGKAGVGRIEIDGTGGTIKGGKGGNDEKGMTITLSGDVSGDNNPKAIELGKGKFLVRYDGSVTASKGLIANWKIDSSWLESGTASDRVVLYSGTERNDTITILDDTIVYKRSNGDLEQISDEDFDKIKGKTFEVDTYTTINNTIYDQFGTGILTYNCFVQPSTVESTNYRFWAGGVTPYSAKFAVTSAGVVYARQGLIGKWNITEYAVSTIANENDSSLRTTGMARSSFKGMYAKNGESKEMDGSVAFWGGLRYSPTTTSYGLQRILDGTNRPSFFAVTHNGNLYCKNADIQGTISADSGNIGSWIIDEGILKSEDGQYFLGPTRVELPGLSIDQDGATFTGTISADEGNIGGWYISSGSLQNYAGSVSLKPTGEIIGAKFRQVEDGGYLTIGSSPGQWGTSYPDLKLIHSGNLEYPDYEVFSIQDKADVIEIHCFNTLVMHYSHTMNEICLDANLRNGSGTLGSIIFEYGDEVPPAIDSHGEPTRPDGAVYFQITE